MSNIDKRIELMEAHLNPLNGRHVTQDDRNLLWYLYSLREKEKQRRASCHAKDTKGE